MSTFKRLIRDGCLSFLAGDWEILAKVEDLQNTFQEAHKGHLLQLKLWMYL